MATRVKRNLASRVKTNLASNRTNWNAAKRVHKNLDLRIKVKLALSKTLVWHKTNRRNWVWNKANWNLIQCRNLSTKMRKRGKRVIWTWPLALTALKSMWTWPLSLSEPFWAWPWLNFSISPCLFLSREFYIYFHNELWNANFLFLLDNQFSYKLKLLGKLVVYHDIVA